MLKAKLAARITQLGAGRTPFVLATVVRAKRPTSVQPGDRAIVLGDGTIEGFVGGVCAESSVRLYSLRALETGQPLLLRLAADEHEATWGADGLAGAIVEHNPCLSGGALEIFLEPQLPPARVLIVGSAPIAEALEQVGEAAGYAAERSVAGEFGDVEGAAAVIVAAHGNGEEGVIESALLAGVPYVALVASPSRGDAVRQALAVPGELAGQLHTPAGLDIGARTPAEIAISILAEMIAAQLADPVPGRPALTESDAAAERSETVAIDPVCGMAVAVTDASLSLEVGGERVYFCGPGCRDSYAAAHAHDASTG